VRFLTTRLSGVTLIEAERFADGRGYFVRTACREEFAAHGLDSAFVQTAHSHSHKRATLPACITSAHLTAKRNSSPA